MPSKLRRSPASVKARSTLPFCTISRWSTATGERIATENRRLPPAPSGLEGVARPRAIDFEAEQRAIAREAPPLLERDPRRLRVELAARVQEHAVQAHRTAQRRVVRHGVGAGAGGQPEAEVEQAVPDLGRRPVIGERDDLEVVDLARDHVRRQLVAQRLLLLRHDREVERMHVAHEPALLVREVGDHAVVRIGARHARCGDSAAKSGVIK